MTPGVPISQPPVYRPPSPPFRNYLASLNKVGIGQAPKFTKWIKLAKPEISGYLMECAGIVIEGRVLSLGDSSDHASHVYCNGNISSELYDHPFLADKRVRLFPTCECTSIV